MLQISGPAALSAFRIAKLLDRLSALDDSVGAVAARFMHFVDVARPLASAEHEVLAALLSYGPQLPSPDETGTCVLVVPRIGTISPWSSKASDIARVCGLASVRRIERGIAYWLRASGPLGGAQLARLAAALHDRMTEDILLDAGQASRLFEH